MDRLKSQDRPAVMNVTTTELEVELMSVKFTEQREAGEEVVDPEVVGAGVVGGGGAAVVVLAVVVATGVILVVVVG